MTAADVSDRSAIGRCPVKRMAQTRSPDSEPDSGLRPVRGGRTRKGTNVSRSAVLMGIGSFLPPRAVSNVDLAARLDTTDEWIWSRTGIARRHHAEPGTATSDLAIGAGAAALKSAGESSVDTVVVATTTPDRPCPGTAPLVASRLGMTGAAAYDVNAVCTGFLYGLATGAGLIAGGSAERVLVIGSETFSSILDPADRTTSVIF